MRPTIGRHPMKGRCELLVEEAIPTVVARARAGDEEAYRRIFERYYGPLCGFAFGMIGNRAEAEELVQETFVRACRKLDSMRDDRHLAAWLFGIARNVVREAIRRKAGRREALSLEEVQPADRRDPGEGPDGPVMTGELRREIGGALASLPEEMREVFVLKVMSGMGYRDISRVTGSSVGKLKTDLHRARLHLRRRLLRYMGADFRGMGGES
jgi:RNA polymerase sigma-70 factor (ECF subfamily)